MKNIITLILLLCATTFFAQNTTKQNDIKTLLEVMESEKEIKEMVNGAIDIYAYKKPDIPQKIWDEIRSKVNYTEYMSNLANIYDINYSQNEIQELIRQMPDLDTTQKTTILKPKVIDEIYQNSKNFGTTFSSLVKEIMLNNGYKF
jgi:hypothetical protein